MNKAATLHLDVLEDPDAADWLTTSNVMEAGDTFFGTRSSIEDDDFIAITLEAGEEYVINMSGDAGFYDTYLYVRDSTGLVVAQDDDSGEGYFSRITFRPSETGTYYIQASAYTYHEGTGSYSVSVSEGKPVEPSNDSVADQMADFLTHGFWGGTPRAFETFSDNVITVNLTALTAEGQQLARWALEAWEAVIDIEFLEQATGGQIVFDDNKSGAYANTSVLGSAIIQSNINISADWIATYGTTIDSYSMQTYIHEIGHAIGLGHQGFYNGSANYASDALFAEDSWQMSIMSYFSQSENTSTNASFAFVVTPQMVDIIAAQNHYGASTVTSGNDVWGGLNATVGTYLDDLFAAQAGGSDPLDIYSDRSVTYTIFDYDGTDILDLGASQTSDRIDLREESFSSVGGAVENLAIARGTLIENVKAGLGDDRIDGNSAGNKIVSNEGNDTVNGFEGNDTLQGGDGMDSLNGGDGNDLIQGGKDDDTLIGGNGDDSIYGENGDDMILGASGNDLLKGGRGKDTITGGDGNNYILGGSSGDSIDAAGGNDTINGGKGNDWILGGTGVDLIDGGKQNDVLTGGDGADTFVFAAKGGHDTITDFDLTEDRLRLDDALWAGGLNTAEVVDTFASIDASGVKFTFDANNTIVLQDVVLTEGLIAIIDIS